MSVRCLNASVFSLSIFFSSSFVCQIFYSQYTWTWLWSQYPWNSFHGILSACIGSGQRNFKSEPQSKQNLAKPNGRYPSQKYELKYWVLTLIQLKLMRIYRYAEFHPSLSLCSLYIFCLKSKAMLMKQNKFIWIVYTSIFNSYCMFQRIVYNFNILFRFYYKCKQTHLISFRFICFHIHVGISLKLNADFRM